MSLAHDLMTAMPELTDDDFFINGTIRLQNDGEGAYIAEWNYSKPLPAGFKVGK